MPRAGAQGHDVQIANEQAWQLATESSLSRRWRSRSWPQAANMPQSRMKMRSLP
jgi:hypothetical protein